MPRQASNHHGGVQFPPVKSYSERPPGHMAACILDANNRLTLPFYSEQKIKKAHEGAAPEVGGPLRDDALSNIRSS